MRKRNYYLKCKSASLKGNHLADFSRNKKGREVNHALFYSMCDLEILPE